MLFHHHLSAARALNEVSLCSVFCNAGNPPKRLQRGMAVTGEEGCAPVPKASSLEQLEDWFVKHGGTKSKVRLPLSSVATGARRGATVLSRPSLLGGRAGEGPPHTDQVLGHPAGQGLPGERGRGLGHRSDTAGTFKQAKQGWAVLWVGRSSPRLSGPLTTALSLVLILRSRQGK